VFLSPGLLAQLVTTSASPLSRRARFNGPEPAPPVAIHQRHHRHQPPDPAPATATAGERGNSQALPRHGPGGCRTAPRPLADRPDRWNPPLRQGSGQIGQHQSAVCSCIKSCYAQRRLLSKQISPDFMLRPDRRPRLVKLNIPRLGNITSNYRDGMGTAGGRKRSCTGSTRRLQLRLIAYAELSNTHAKVAEYERTRIRSISIKELLRVKAS
jgi:hypothetical protein